MLRLVIRICVAPAIALVALSGSSASSHPLTITEFLAANTTDTPADEGGPAGDWIEIYNESGEAVDTNGWYLTDRPANLTRWKMPSREIPAGGYLVVHASGSNVAPASPGEPLRANFKLRIAGEFLALVEPDGKTIASQFAPAYPLQRPDVSYGLSQDDAATLAYFREPTPGKANGTEGVLGFVEDAKLSPSHGFFSQPFTLEITTATEGAGIRYTTDGSEPTLEYGVAYTEPIEISRTTVIRAAAFKDGFEPTNIESQTYLFTADIIKQKNMDKDVVEDPLYADIIEDALKSIPTISLVLPRSRMFGSGGIYARTGNRGDASERAVSIEFFDAAGEERGFQLDGGVRIHGGDARTHAKKPMKLYFRERYGASKLRYPLFEGSPVQAFDRLVLRSCGHEAWSDPRSIQARSATYVRDEFHRLTHLEMGHLSPRGRFVHLYINGDYWGLYNLHERADHFMGSAHLGGEPEDYDVIKTGAEVVSGEKTAWQNLQQLAEGGLEDAVAFAKIVESIDLESFIDYMTVQIWTANVDWLRSQRHIGSTGDRNKNWYALRKTRNGEAQWHFFVWDAEFGIGKDHTSDRHLNFNMADVDIGDSPGRLYAKLKENDDFRLLFGEQLQKHFFNGGAMTPENNLARFDRLVARIREAVVAESARWGDQLRRRRDKPYTRDAEWQDEVAWIRETWMAKRNDIVIEDFREIGLYPEVDSPELLVDGKRVTGSNILAGSEISFEPASGVILYTLDGSDPRASGLSAESVTIPEEFAPPTRAVVPYGEAGNAGVEARIGKATHAIAFHGPVTLDRSVTLKARVLKEGEYSALTQATILAGDLAGPANLVISEVHYRPLPPQSDAEHAAGSSRRDFEFIEMTNIGSNAVDLSRTRFTEGITFQFEFGTSVAAGESVVLANNAAAFLARYGTAPDGEFSGNLANNGEAITLVAADMSIIKSFQYSDSDPWPDAADGDGPSLELLNPSDNPDHADPKTWRASAEPGGSP